MVVVEKKETDCTRTSELQNSTTWPNCRSPIFKRGACREPKFTNHAGEDCLFQIYRSHRGTFSVSDSGIEERVHYSNSDITWKKQKHGFSQTSSGGAVDAERIKCCARETSGTAAMAFCRLSVAMAPTPSPSCRQFPLPRPPQESEFTLELQ
ncbi:hypothetical protein C8R44DRAFT_746427 [Mycena epipterygia]|nr:hypothetical protein C8R44DRAFT_746427 [Mycena epipterygia]